MGHELLTSILKCYSVQLNKFTQEHVCLFFFFRLKWLQLKKLSLKKIFKMLVSFQILCQSFLSVLGQEKVPLPRTDSSYINFTCLDGSYSLPYSYVNDDYCDCLDGSDETRTAACPNGYFICENKGHKLKRIPSSRINDGICDCCDGSDEFLSGKCPNECEALAVKDKAEELLIIGNQIRLEFAVTGKQIKLDRETRMVELESIRMEYIRVLTEKELQKNVTERKKLEVLESIGVIKSAEDEKKVEEIKVANNIFSIVDANKDEILQLDEIRKRPMFDEDKDGVVSNEELNFFTDSQVEITRAVFYSNVWSKIKKMYLLDKVDFLPKVSEHTEYKIVKDFALNLAKEGQKISEVEKLKIYDQNTKEIIQKAINARAEYNTAKDALDTIEKELAAVRAKLSTDYGPENEFYLLEGTCFNYSDHKFFYKICPFHKVIQSNQENGPETILGFWNGWLNHDHKTMFYDRGEFCWKDNRRYVKINMNCGLKNEIVQVQEPTSCEYIFELSTPAGCRIAQPIAHDEL